MPLLLQVNHSSRKEDKLRTELIKLTAFLESWSDPYELSIGLADFDDCMAFIHLTCQSLQKKFEQCIDQLSGEIEITKYVQSAQLRLTHLADSAANRSVELKAAGGAPLPDRMEISPLVNEIHIRLIKILDYLHIYYAPHFNHTARLPLKYSVLENQSGSSAWLGVIKRLQEQQIDKNLIILLEIFIGQLDHEGDRLIKTWKQFDYIYELLFELEAFLKEEESDDTTMKLIMLLIAQDFNHIRFYWFLMSYVEALQSGNTSFLEQQILLNDLLSRFETIRIERKGGFNPDIKPIRDSVCGMLSKKIKHLERSKGLHHKKAEKTSNKKSSGFYFSVASTIQELMFLTWVMVEVRFIKTKYNEHLYAFVENHVRAEYTNHPSPAYMRNHFGNKDVSENVVRKVREWLQRMIWFIDEHFKEQLKG